MPNYSREGKIQTPITEDEFIEGMSNGHFCQDKHRAFSVLLYYTGVRKKEALRSVRDDFILREDKLIFDVGPRLKHGKHTPPLTLPLAAPYMNELYECVKDTEEDKRIFPYSDKTGYNIVRRVWKYPHLFRLTRITNFFMEGWTIAQVRSWTGLTLKALEFYVGLVDTIHMGESLAKKQSQVCERGILL
jgi:integrase